MKSLKKQRYYIGHTADLQYRLKAHNLKKVRSTKAFSPWKVVYTETLLTKQKAYKREVQIKSYKGGCAFKELFKEGCRSGQTGRS